MRGLHGKLNKKIGVTSLSTWEKNKIPILAPNVSYWLESKELVGISIVAPNVSYWLESKEFVGITVLTAAADAESSFFPSPSDHTHIHNNFPSLYKFPNYKVLLSVGIAINILRSFKLMLGPKRKEKERERLKILLYFH